MNIVQVCFLVLVDFISQNMLFYCCNLKDLQALTVNGESLVEHHMDLHHPNLPTVWAYYLHILQIVRPFCFS